ncbi:unnamed protein product [Blepharisma stoltei]|uniref:Protein kinase domain-containing protein n=1 Tax=Blepharisma stoltei TaxID=1481888 RepID=A0AAU9IU29_9CILI|nr:unnamed protein product [Blepharisma stoltei]
MQTIFEKSDISKSGEFWTPTTEAKEKLTKSLVYQGVLWELIQPGLIKKRNILVSGKALFVLKKDLSVAKKMVNLEWKIVEPFVETCNERSRYGLRILYKSHGFDFYAESSEDLDHWVENLSKIAIMTNVEDDYEFAKVIGRGGFAKIYLAKNIETQQDFAIKSIEKSQVVNFPSNFAQLVSEIKIMRSLDHPNVVKLHKVYESETHIHLVLDYLAGGDLMKRLKLKSFYPEELAAKLVYKLLQVLSYLHSMGITHRDIKLENIVLLSKSNDIEFKLIDFGLSCENTESMKLRCGSPGYVAPEILMKQPYTSKVDIYSAGILLYTLLSGVFPYCEIGWNQKSIAKSKDFRLFFEDEQWSHVSRAAIQMVIWMTDPNPSCRISIEDALTSKWISSFITGIKINDIHRNSKLRIGKTRGEISRVKTCHTERDLALINERSKESPATDKSPNSREEHNRNKQIELKEAQTPKYNASIRRKSLHILKDLRKFENN